LEMEFDYRKFKQFLHITRKSITVSFNLWKDYIRPRPQSVALNKKEEVEKRKRRKKIVIELI
jgi:hypothetical protein